MRAEVLQVRAFSRAVTRRFGALDEQYLGRRRPLAEARLLFEVGMHATAVRNLRARLGLDSGFLSRLLRSLERQGLLVTESARDDGRIRVARLTRAGRRELHHLNALSDALARSVLAPLSPEQARRLVAAMAEVERLLCASSITITPAQPGDQDAADCRRQYFQELGSRFPEGFRPTAAHTLTLRRLEPRAGRVFVARLAGDAVGFGAVRRIAPGMGEIKHMWIAPRVRGLGVGRRLLAELERAARRMRVRVLRLDTHASLTEALGLYRSAGYRKIPRYNDNPYAQHWFEKVLVASARPGRG